MSRTYARSERATLARTLVEGLQDRFVARLASASRTLGDEQAFEWVEWLRDDGRHGGGTRRSLGDTAVFDRASINVSQVHYDDEPNKRLGSATALSAIVHPRSPHAPSIHVHISWTEMKDGSGYWRIMADLNPAIPHPADADAFEQVLRGVVPDLYEQGAAQGDRYFYIPALERHRGVKHFYLEGHATADPLSDAMQARRVGQAVVDHYGELLAEASARQLTPSPADAARQLEYHTLYLFQVLTLDRGTTSGLLVHDQNDVGIMGSLPSHVDRALLSSWRDRMPPPQGELLDAIVAALPDGTPSPVTDDAKRALAHAVRHHYRGHPEAISLQASGDVIPPTVDNHR